MMTSDQPESLTTWSHHPMSEELKAIPARLSRTEFLAALAESAILPEPALRRLRDDADARDDGDDAGILARRLVREGLVTSFQARRLLKGKRGLVVGRYILLDLIGQGARGRVYKARHRLMDRVVALKAIVPDAALSQRTVSRFFREMKIVAMVDHPNVVRAIDADAHAGFPYIVMEYLEGKDLEHRIARRGPLPPEEVMAYMAQAARGLAHAHEKGIIHRDIKPTNLFLTKDGIVKVLDLGFGELLCDVAKKADPFDTDEGALVGTTDYMSPEQLSYEAIDPRTDLFSLGCTMYRLLTGAFAFPGETREDRLVRRLHAPHVPITDLRPDLPYPLVRIVDRLLATRPEDRYQSAAEVAEDLEILLPPAYRTGRRAGPVPSEAALAPLHSEPEAPPDWALIESALREPARRASRPSLADDRDGPSARDLSAHRDALEAEGLESGREAHEKYRGELIQMNRVMSELRAMDPKDEEDARRETWLERLGETLGDQLAEPNALLIVLGALGLVMILGLALAVAIG
jgi:serine/threonine-protein kinase